EAVKIVSEKKNSSLAAIGTKQASKIYGVPIIRKNIGDHKNNETRFAVIGKEKNNLSGKDKTSLMFHADNRPGALMRALEIFDVMEINLTMLISRPSKIKLGEYIFFADIEGHQKEPKIKFALETLENKVGSLKILGSYPFA
ncbi:MAG: prephenate dehydratase domain-containing protein, partial [Candidatus Pacebacteria bacterium]|nr:prephenate dehydratase domain-containing protein [Candidatus Paceibacterota bacterium]